MRDQEVQTYQDAVTFSARMTPTLNEVGSDQAPITPRYGGERGGEIVTFRGANMNAGSNGKVWVFIDTVPCNVTRRTETMFRCTTGDRPFVAGLEPSLNIYVDGKGWVATRGQVYRYVSRWSERSTWGNDLLPAEGEAVVVPKGQHLLVDVPVVPRLAFALVEGSLIFESEA